MALTALFVSASGSPFKGDIASNLANMGTFVGAIRTGLGVLIAELGYYEGKIERKRKAMRLISLMPREDMYGAPDVIALKKDYECIKSLIKK